MALERLDKILSSQGLGSRKEIKDWAKQGRIQIDGVVCKDSAQKTDPLTAKITLGGKAIVYQKYVYLLLNKKAGYITATEDKKQATVLDLLPDKYKKMDLFPAGRLDKDTEGLLLLTNDGAFSHEIMSPRHHVPKTYYARICGEIKTGAENIFAEGLLLEDGYRCLPAILRRLSDTEVEITIAEGKYHQVKRMVAAMGGHVEYLKRIAIGSIYLPDAMPLGDFRMLTEDEVTALRG